MVSDKQDICLDDITRDERLQVRESCNQEYIDRYAELLSQGTRFPAIALFRIDGRLLLADGFHRYHAARAAGLETLPAEIFEGSLHDALLHALNANNRHGLHLTNKEKRRAVEILMKDEDWSQWSDREVARRTGVSYQFVAELRSASTNVGRYSGDGNEPHLPMLVDTPATRTVTRGGITYQMKIGNIGKRQAPGQVAHGDKATTTPWRGSHPIYNAAGLLPCPFCGAQGPDFAHGPEGHAACCPDPDCNVVGPRKPTRDEAREGWNRRA